MSQRLLCAAVLLCATACSGGQSACTSGGRDAATTAGTESDAPPAAPLRGNGDQGRIVALRGQIRDLRMALERREERRELIDRQLRSLYEVARAAGLKATLSADQLYPVDPPQQDLPANGRPDLRIALTGVPAPADPTGARTRTLDAFRQWLGRAGRGEVRLDGLGAAASEVRYVATAQRAALGPVIHEEKMSRGEILRLTTEIGRTVDSIETKFDQTATADIDRLLQSLGDVRAAVEADDLAGRATMVDTALAGLLRAPSGSRAR